MADVSLSDINKRAKECPEKLVSEAESRYHGFVSEVSDRIAGDDNIKIVLIAGPSGSGKTTTANLLSDSLERGGLESFVLSLDDFYRDATDHEYPRLVDGSRDFESPDALNLPELRKTLSDIAEGKEYEVPHFDFKKGMRSCVEKHPKISHGCVIIEGLHALNPQIYESLPNSCMLKIFISVSSNITEDDTRVLSGRKLRFVRRMVRDSLYRGADAERTLDMWLNVLRGEDKYLYPYRDNADISFDTFHAFEFGVTKPFVLKLISEELAEENPYAKTVREASKRAVAVRESLVPENSLIREFIPGGIYEDLYLNLQ